MKLSVFVAVLLPSVSAFVVPRIATRTGTIPSTNERCSLNSVAPLKMTASEDANGWSIASIWHDLMGTAADVEQKVDTTASEAYAELRKKVLAKKQRQQLEGQLCSLLRISGDHQLSPKVEQQVRRLTAELEALQANGNVIVREKFGVCGSWKLMYSSSKSNKCLDVEGSVEDISYVSENYRISHADTGVLRVYKRMVSPAASASKVLKAKSARPPIRFN